MNPDCTPPPEPDVTDAAALDYAAEARLHGRGNPVLWTIAFLFFPIGPFIYLAVLGALRWPTAILLAIASAIIHNGTVFILSRTNGASWQPLLTTALVLFDFGIGRLQFKIGDCHSVWSWQGKRLWRGAAWIVGALIVLNVAVVSTTLFIRYRWH